MEIESIGDTMIQGKNCRYLIKNNGFEKNEFVYRSGDTVYRLADNDTFYVLYNFAAQVGEKWVTRASLFNDGSPEEQMTITVDSLSSEIINGYLLKVLFVSSNHPAISFGGYWAPVGTARIIERLGGSWYMFPFNYAFLDYDIRIGLRCYSDDSLGFYNAGISQSCDEVITDINDENNRASSSIFPNPFSNQLTLTLSNNEPATITLYDVCSRQVLQQAFTNSTTLNTEQFANGIYFYELRNDKGVVKKGKVVRQ